MKCIQIACISSDLNAIMKFLSSEDEHFEDFIRESRSRTNIKVRNFLDGVCFFLLNLRFIARAGPFFLPGIFVGAFSVSLAGFVGLNPVPQVRLRAFPPVGQKPPHLVDNLLATRFADKIVPLLPSSIPYMCLSTIRLYDNAVTFSSRVLAFLAVCIWSFLL